MSLRVVPLLFFLLFALPLSSEGQVISGPDARLVGNDIFVGFSVSLDSQGVQDIRNGIRKELKFYVDLFKSWKGWPDEFILGKAYTKTLRSDPVKREYVATSFDGYVLIEKRFRSFESMMDWVMTFKDLKLTNVRELDPGQYFVKVTIESKILNLPPVIGHLLIFIPENEFRIKKDSSFFTIEGAR